MFDDHVDWLVTMGLIRSANVATDGQFTINNQGNISWIGNDCIEDLNRLIIEEIMRSKND